jgi:hypothetical protein
VDSSDFQNLLDLNYPVDKVHTRDSDSWSGWRNHRLPTVLDNCRADKRNIHKCRAVDVGGPVEITEHTLDGEAFL